MKSRIIWVAAILSILYVSADSQCYCAELILNNSPTWVCFSPEGLCTEGIIRHIDEGTREILVQAYSFNSSSIRKTLLKAQKRGVKLEIILDEGEEKEQHFKTAMFFAKGGASVYIDSTHTCSHNKVIIIDRTTVITGSFNFTIAAEKKNAENVLAVKSPVLAENYAENWLAHRQHSIRYK